jgi:SM-20-related protein
MSTRDAAAMREAVKAPVRTVDTRCPHLLYRNVMGADYVAALLDYVDGRQAQFRPGRVHDRRTDVRSVDLKVRDCLYVNGLGRLEAPIRSVVATIAAPALQALQLIEPAVEPKEFDIGAYGDGGHFRPHIDTLEQTERVRILSCVYYFAVTPRRFTGGQLRLHGFPRPSVGGEGPGAGSFVDIEPETDSLVIFPSWLRHEVLPVRLPSGAWTDRRFSINCWIHRVTSDSRAHKRREQPEPAPSERAGE